MRIVNTSLIEKKVTELLLDASYVISEDIMNKLKESKQNESSDIAKFVLEQIIKNDEIACNQNLPMCQDTGLAIIFLEIGQEVCFEGESLTAAINKGVANAYINGYLRKSSVEEPLFERKNTNDNTPAIIHTEIVPGDKITITVSPKGFGSENMSKIKMLKPADGIKGVKDFVIDCVKQAGPNPCPPIVVGVGIGGTFEKCAYMAKKALNRTLNTPNEDPRYAELERELLEEINKLNIGPAGLGGKTTALSVNIDFMATHIAGLPVAVSIGCHACRHKKGTI